ncbi:hypothetical protein CsatA_017775 [Cannabis sativa]
MKMNSFIVLALSLFLVNSSEGWSYDYGNIGDYYNNRRACMNQYLDFTPCIGEMFSFTYTQKPISSTCCDKVKNITPNTDLCSHTLPYYRSFISRFAFYQAQLHCNAPTTNIPPPPPPATPSQSLLPPPSPPSPPAPYFNGLARKYCAEEPRLHKCYKEIALFRLDKAPIPKECCDTIIDVINKCPNAEWAQGLLDCASYCKSAQKTAP